MGAKRNAKKWGKSDMCRKLTMRGRAYLRWNISKNRDDSSSKTSVYSCNVTNISNPLWRLQCCWSSMFSIEESFFYSDLSCFLRNIGFFASKPLQSCLTLFVSTDFRLLTMKLPCSTKFRESEVTTVFNLCKNFPQLTSHLGDSGIRKRPIICNIQGIAPEMEQPCCWGNAKIRTHPILEYFQEAHRSAPTHAKKWPFRENTPKTSHSTMKTATEAMLAHLDLPLVGSIWAITSPGFNIHLVKRHKSSPDSTRRDFCNVHRHLM